MTTVSQTERLAMLRLRTAQMLEMLEHLVSIESPSADSAATARCAQAVAALMADKLGVTAELLESSGRSHLWAAVGAPRVLLLGHIDTVWPEGTLARWPFSVDGDQATGPGSFDMKAGVVQGLFALAALDDVDGVAVLLTSDEELGSPSSRSLVEEKAAGRAAVLVLEPSADAALKIARKGVSNYFVHLEGRASHAGLNPADGVNATVEAAHQVLAIEEMGRSAGGTTVTPTVLTSGTVMNVVPAEATLSVDVRAESLAEQMRVDEEMRRLRPRVAGARVTIDGGPNRPPLSRDASGTLFREACAVADELGLPTLAGVAVGGGSDGNFTAGIGVPTLDGLGPVGDGAHSEGEHVIIPAMAERAALVAGLIERIQRAGAAP